MVLRITNQCMMGCMHCMERSTPKGTHASMVVVQQMVEFAKRVMHDVPLLSKRIVMVSGGEPTNHPDFFKIMDLLVKELDDVTIVVATNGEYFVTNPSLGDKMIDFMRDNRNVSLQVTTIDGLYRNHHALVEVLKNTRNELGEVAERIGVITSLTTGVVLIGRAKDNADEISKIADIHDAKAFSCFNSYSALSACNGNLIDAFSMLKRKLTYAVCKPLVKENGDISPGEYDECSVIGNIMDMCGDDWVVPIKDIDGPCGSCIRWKSQIDMTEHAVGHFKGYARNVDYNNLLDG